jgi:predicted HTH domain antitoxin
MNVIVRIPDELAARLTAEGGDLEQRALEAFGLAEYQAGRLFESDLCQLLGLSRYEVDGFLKERGIFHDYTQADLEREQETLDRLGF